MKIYSWVQICCAWKQVLWLLLVLLGLKGLTFSIGLCLCFLIEGHLLLDLS